MKVPHLALVALANGERFKLMRNVGQPFEPKLEAVTDLDLELTNFSAGVRHQDPAGQRNGFVHDAEILARCGSEYARCDVAMRYAG